MKANTALLIFVMTAFILPAIAQTRNTQTPTIGIISLKNSDGEVVSQSKDTIARSFFTTQTCTILYSQPLKTDERFMCVLQRLDGGESRAYSLNNAILSVELKKYIEKAPAGTLVTFMITKSGKGSGPQLPALQIVLK